LATEPSLAGQAHATAEAGSPGQTGAAT
jgi:hypothetical protein